MQVKPDNKLLEKIGEIADENNFEVYVVGGYIRDIILNKECKDIDILVIGSGIEFATLVAKNFKKEIVVYEKFGTALVNFNDIKLEFVGARKESYRSESRNPIVTQGTLYEDIARRDFTINALAVSLNKKNLYNLIDQYTGLHDIESKIIRTPLEPDKTFSDDPLRMMRAVRFASTLGFTLFNETFEGIKKSAERIKIISQERITDELLKIIRSKKPSVGIKLLYDTGLLKFIFPELNELAVMNRAMTDGGKEHYHKDVFLHSIKVMDNIASQTDNIWLRFVGLVHDIGKPKTRRFDKVEGWTFHGHDDVGSRMVDNIFKKLKLPFDKIDYTKKLIRLHLRPIALVEESVTDSAIRRLIFEAGEEIFDLMLLCEADITSQSLLKVEAYRKNYDYIKKRIVEVEEKDHIRNFQPPVKGDEIMEIYGLTPGPKVGKLKNALTDAILDGIIKNDRAEALAFLENEYKKIEL
jgi:tRNA nucleotidyltransferase/poly(A) polymerase